MTKRQKDTIVGLGVALASVIFYSALGADLFDYAREHDFLGLMTGPAIVASGHAADLYQLEAQQAANHALAPHASLFLPFVRPPFQTAFFLPFTWLSFESAWKLWLAVEILAMFAIWAWCWRRLGPESLALCALFPPMARSIMHGQDSAMVALIALLAFLAAEKRRDILAGVLVALLLVKFHLFLLLPIAMLLRKRWRMLTAFCVVAAAEAALSIAMVGWAGIAGYVHFVNRADLPTLSPSMPMMANVHGLAAAVGLDWTWLRVLLTLAAAGLALYGVTRAGEGSHWFWIAIAGSLLLPPHTYIYDMAMLVPPAMLAMYQHVDKQFRIAAGFLLSPVPYLFTYLGPPLSAMPALTLITFFCLLLRYARRGERTIVAI